MQIAYNFIFSTTFYYRSSSSYGWSDNIHKSPSTSYTAPKASLPATNTGSYGWNVNGQNGGIQKQTNTGLNAGNTGSYGWNVNGVNGGVQKQTNTGLNAGNTQAGWNIGQGAQKPISPVGPPPAYPGMGHHPVASHSQPPAYSPSHVNPPAYSPSHNNPYGSATNTHYNQQYGQNQNNHQFGGSSFSNGGAYNGFGHHPVVNNYYGSQQSRGGFGSNLMTNAMFYGIGMHHGHSWG